MRLCSATSARLSHRIIKLSAKAFPSFRFFFARSNFVCICKLSIPKTLSPPPKVHKEVHNHQQIHNVFFSRLASHTNEWQFFYKWVKIIHLSPCVHSLWTNGISINEKKRYFTQTKKKLFTYLCNNGIQIWILIAHL